MARPSVIRRAGMTLVELLVVVAIIGLLAVTVLPSLGNTTEARRTRETARMVTSFIAKAQAAGLGRTAAAGFVLLRESGATIDMAPAMVPDPYRGDADDATVSGTMKLLPNGLRGMGLSFAKAFTSGTWLQCADGDLIRFDGTGPWYLVTVQGGTACTMRSGTSTIDSLAGQTETNTPWPEPNVQHAFELLRRPAVSGAVLSLGNGRCVDTAWSSASQPAFEYFGAPTSPILPSDPVFVLFDRAGSVRQIVAGVNRFAPDGPVLLLVGRVDRAGQNWTPLSAADDTIGANWQYPESAWIAIDQASGICRTAACDAVSAAQAPPPSADTADKQVAWRWRQSQNFVLAELQAEGR